MDIKNTVRIFDIEKSFFDIENSPLNYGYRKMHFSISIITFYDIENSNYRYWTIIFDIENAFIDIKKKRFFDIENYFSISIIWIFDIDK